VYRQKSGKFKVTIRHQGKQYGSTQATWSVCCVEIPLMCDISLSKKKCTPAFQEVGFLLATNVFMAGITVECAND